MRLRLFVLLLLCASTLVGQAPAKRTPTMQWEQAPSLPDVHGFAGMFAGANRSGLWVAGGANFPEGKPWEGGTKRWHTTIFQLDAPTGRWQTFGRLEHPRAYGVTVSIDDYVLCIGGSDATKHWSTIEPIAKPSDAASSSHASAISWPSLPRPCANGAGVLIGRQFYLFGGTESPTSTEGLRQLLRLDFDQLDQGWVELPPLPGAGRMLSVLGTDGKKVFLFGGVSLRADAAGKPEREYLKEAWCFDPERQRWHSLATMPRATAGTPGPTPRVNDWLMLLSGDDGQHVGFQPPDQHPGFPREVLWYDMVKDRWAQASLPDETFRWSRATSGWVPWYNHWLLPSGETRPGVRTPEVLMLQLFPSGS